MGLRTLQQDAVSGAIAGAMGTFAMTAAMERLQGLLPRGQRYAMPPREVTERALERLKLDLHDRDLKTAALAAHFTYGALAGALFGLLGRRSRASGVRYGLLVWAASYLGWIPAAGLLTPATRHPLLRNLIMIAAHAVWGASTAAAANELRASRQRSFAGAVGDAR